MKFDPLDKTWQVSPEYAPDKTGTWPYSASDDGWTLSHNSIRAEMTLMIEAIESAKSRGSIQEWEVACIQQFWNAHNTHIHSHHSNEDNKAVPKLQERFHYPEKCVSDHDELVAKLDEVAAIVKALGQKEGDSVNELLNELKVYQKMMVPHLQLEEDQSLPLMRAYFTHEEWGKITEDILKGSPKVEMGSFIMCQGVDNFRNKFMAQEGIPCIAWHAEFKGCAAVFEREFTTPLNAIKSGVEPETKEGCSCNIQ